MRLKRKCALFWSICWFSRLSIAWFHRKTSISFWSQQHLRLQQLSRRLPPQSPFDPSDPDFIGPKPPKVPKQSKSDDITITLNRHKLIRDLHPHIRRDKITPAAVFRICATTVQSGGGDLASFPLSAEWIRLKCKELDAQTANTIRVRYWDKIYNYNHKMDCTSNGFWLQIIEISSLQENFIFPRFVSAHYDGKIRESWGK